MNKKKVSIAIFKKGKKILIQDRRPWDKYNFEYGFFGGKVEEGENPEQTLKREIKEELNILIKNFKFYKHTIKKIPEINLEIEYFIFFALIPDLNKIKCEEGKPFLTDIEKALKLKMNPGDISILKELNEN